jgi:hypothetical protein
MFCLLLPLNKLGAEKTFVQTFFHGAKKTEGTEQQAAGL